MADTNNGGVTFDSAPVTSPVPQGAPSAGVTFDTTPIGTSPTIGDRLGEAVHQASQPFRGMIHAAADTAQGAMGAADYVSGKVLDAFGVPKPETSLSDVVTGATHHESPDAFTKTRDFLKQHSQNTGVTPEEKTGQNIGYGGESLLEFFLGDEALKGMSLADKALAASKTLKVVEKSPRLMEALKAGAKQVAANAGRAGAVQGTQTALRTGDLGEGLKAGAEAAATGGILEGAGRAAGAGIRAAGKAVSGAGKTAAELAETAAGAPDKQTIVENIQGQLQNAQTAMHETYEKGVQDLEGRLQGSQIAPKEAPISKKAQDILKKPDPEDHEFVQQAAEARGQKLDKPVKSLLENIANGKAPLTDEDIAAAEEANANKPKLVDAQGKPIESPDVEPEAKDAGPLDATGVIKLRQEVRQLASQYEPGDVNARALKRLLWDTSDHSSAIDDTFEALAQKSTDPKAVTDYQNLRADYRNKVNRFDNPVIKNLMEGKPDDAAKAFLGTKNAAGLASAGKTGFDTDNLKEIIGDEGFGHFRDEVFKDLLHNSTSNGVFNAADFVSSWKKLADRTKGGFFEVKNPKIGPKTQIESALTDAKSVANYQKLVRAGLILGAGAGAGTLSPVAGTGISALLAFTAGSATEHGGAAKVRSVIDYIANNPKLWAGLRKAGAATENSTAIDGKAAATVGKTIVNQVNANQRNPYAGTEGLGDTRSN